MDPSLDRDECEEKDCNFKKIGLLFMSSENAKKVLFFPLDGWSCVAGIIFVREKKGSCL